MLYFYLPGYFDFVLLHGETKYLLCILIWYVKTSSRKLVVESMLSENGDEQLSPQEKYKMYVALASNAHEMEKASLALACLLFKDTALGRYSRAGGPPQRHLTLVRWLVPGAVSSSSQQEIRADLP